LQLPTFFLIKSSAPFSLVYAAEWAKICSVTPLSPELLTNNPSICYPQSSPHAAFCWKQLRERLSKFPDIELEYEFLIACGMRNLLKPINYASICDSAGFRMWFDRAQTQSRTDPSRKPHPHPKFNRLMGSNICIWQWGNLIVGSARLTWQLSEIA